MKTSIHFYRIFSRFLMECEMFQTYVVEKSKLTFYVQYFLNRAVCEIMWKTRRGGQATDDNVLRRICIACRIPKVIAFALRQWLHERT
jgi:hypothetical protein